MAVKMRLRREGKKKQPFYRVVVADVRSPRDGRFIEDIGYYQPTHSPSTISINHERALHWLRNGVQPSDAVTKLLRIEGIWEEFKPGDTGRDRSVKHQQRAARAEAKDRARQEAEESAANERRAREAEAAAAAAPVEETAQDIAEAEVVESGAEPEPAADSGAPAEAEVVESGAEPEPAADSGAPAESEGASS